MDLSNTEFPLVPLMWFLPTALLIQHYKKKTKQKSEMLLFSLQRNGTERFFGLNHEIKFSVLWKILDGTGKYLMVFITKVFWPDGFTGVSYEHHSLETESSKERNFYK